MSEREQARSVLLSALSGDLSLEDFHDRWPDRGDLLVDTIFEETEDTIEHAPGSLFGRDQNLRDSLPHKILVVDAQLLRDEFSGISSQRLVEIRRRLLEAINLRQDDEMLTTEAREFIVTNITGTPE